MRTTKEQREAWRKDILHGVVFPTTDDEFLAILADLEDAERWEAALREIAEACEYDNNVAIAQAALAGTVKGQNR